MSSVPPIFESRWLGSTSGSGASWLEALRPGRVVALLLLEGAVRIEWAGKTTIGPNTLLWMHTGCDLPQSWELLPGGRHEALLLLYPVEWLEVTLAPLRQQMGVEFRSLLLGFSRGQRQLMHPLEAEDRAWSRALMAPTLCAAARQLLEGSRMSEFLFRKVLTAPKNDEFFCTRTRRIAMERVSKVREALQANLEEPPTLDELAALCGCNPQYLSRTFSETAGTTISLYLRRMRIERAAELLSHGHCNASEAALEVGYRSLSHFSQAFRAEKGMPPSEWARRGQPVAFEGKESNSRQSHTTQRQPDVRIQLLSTATP